MRLTDKYSWSEIVDKTSERVGHVIIKKGYKIEEFKEWMLSKEKLGYVFDYNLWLKAYLIVRDLQKDVDYFTVCSGREGSGKSTLLGWFNAVISPTFSLQHICFELPDLVKALRIAKVGDSILLDEGLMFLFSREAMSGGNKYVTKLFSIMRQLNIHVTIAVPNFFSLDTYIREHRVNVLLHVTDTGKYLGLNGKGIMYCNDKAKKFKNPAGIRYRDGQTWRGYWNETNEYGHKFPVINDVNWKEYKRLKGEHMKKFLDDIEKYSNESDEVVERLYVSTKEFGLATGLNQENIVRLIKKNKIKGKKIGNRWLIERAELETPRIGVQSP